VTFANQPTTTGIITLAGTGYSNGPNGYAHLLKAASLSSLTVVALCVYVYALACVCVCVITYAGHSTRYVEVTAPADLDVINANLQANNGVVRGTPPLTLAHTHTDSRTHKQ
jgi:hypothetical protein